MPEFVEVLAEDALGVGEGRTVEARGRRIAVFRTEDGWFACDDVCPHAGGSLGGGHVSAGCVACPLHFWEFDLATGEYLDDPGVTIETFEVRLEEGKVLVRV